MEHPQTSQENNKAKITIEVPGAPSQTLEVDDFCLVHVQNKQVSVASRDQGSAFLLDHAFWTWKIGGIVSKMLPSRPDPSRIVIPR